MMYCQKVAKYHGQITAMGDNVDAPSPSLLITKFYTENASMFARFVLLNMPVIPQLL